MKLNESNGPLLVAGHKYESIWTKTAEVKIWESNRQNSSSAIGRFYNS